jgi:outer membrane cobalamin receptor
MYFVEEYWIDIGRSSTSQELQRNYTDTSSTVSSVYLVQSTSQQSSTAHRDVVEDRNLVSTSWNPSVYARNTHWESTLHVSLVEVAPVRLAIDTMRGNMAHC